MGPSMSNPQKFIKQDEERKYVKHKERQARLQKKAKSQTQIREAESKINNQKQKHQLTQSSPIMQRETNQTLPHQQIQQKEGKLRNRSKSKGQHAQIQEGNCSIQRQMSQSENSFYVRSEGSQKGSPRFNRPRVAKSQNENRNNKKSQQYIKNTNESEYGVNTSNNTHLIPKTKTIIFNKHVYTVDVEKLKAHRLLSKLRYENGISSMKGYSQQEHALTQNSPFLAQQQQPQTSKSYDGLELQSQLNSNIKSSSTNKLALGRSQKDSDRSSNHDYQQQKIIKIKQKKFPQHYNANDRVSNSQQKVQNRNMKSVTFQKKLTAQQHYIYCKSTQTPFNDSKKQSQTTIVSSSLKSRQKLSTNSGLLQHQQPFNGIYRKQRVTTQTSDNRPFYSYQQQVQNKSQRKIKNNLKLTKIVRK